MSAGSNLTSRQRNSNRRKFSITRAQRKAAQLRLPSLRRLMPLNRVRAMRRRTDRRGSFCYRLCSAPKSRRQTPRV